MIHETLVWKTLWWKSETTRGLLLVNDEPPIPGIRRTPLLS